MLLKVIACCSNLITKQLQYEYLFSNSRTCNLWVLNMYRIRIYKTTIVFRIAGDMKIVSEHYSKIGALTSGFRSRKNYLDPNGSASFREAVSGSSSKWIAESASASKSEAVGKLKMEPWTLTLSRGGLNGGVQAHSGPLESQKGDSACRFASLCWRAGFGYASN